MAATRFISTHVRVGATVAQCLKDSFAYAHDPSKTDGGRLVTAYELDPATADMECLLAKRQYQATTGRAHKRDVVLYKIRQSFRPGEITPEDANRIGYELAMRWTKGRYAFTVSTHVDQAHIHNHVIINPISQDYTHKFRDFLGSGLALQRLSDRLCLEHGLSIIENPKRGNHSYGKWLGDKQRFSNKDKLKLAIDAALAEKPSNYADFLRRMAAAGYQYKPGKQPGFLAAGWKKCTRLRSLHDGYSEAAITAVIAGERKHTPMKRQAYSVQAPAKAAPNLLIDIQAKLQAGKGGGYERWAKVFNLKQMAQTLNYLSENGLLEYAALEEKAVAASTRFNELSAQIKDAEKRLAEIAVLKTHIINYAKTRDAYAGYRKAGYSKKYLAEHESEIILHKAAKKAFDELGVKKLPTVKSLQTEYATVLAAKKHAYGEYVKARSDMREVQTAKANVDRLLGQEKDRRIITQEQERK